MKMFNYVLIAYTAASMVSVHAMNWNSIKKTGQKSWNTVKEKGSNAVNDLANKGKNFAQKEVSRLTPIVMDEFKQAAETFIREKLAQNEASFDQLQKDLENKLAQFSNKLEAVPGVKNSAFYNTFKDKAMVVAQDLYDQVKSELDINKAAQLLNFSDNASDNNQANMPMENADSANAQADSATDSAQNETNQQ